MLHSNARHQLTVTAASVWVALKLVYGTVRPYALKSWQIVSSERAKRCYEFVILGAIALVWMSAFAAVWLGNRSREQYDRFTVWRDAFVESHLEQPAAVVEAVSDAIAEQGVALLTELFTQVDAIMAAPLYDEPALVPVVKTAKRRRKTAKV